MIKKKIIYFVLCLRFGEHQHFINILLRNKLFRIQENIVVEIQGTGSDSIYFATPRYTIYVGFALHYSGTFVA